MTILPLHSARSEILSTLKTDSALTAVVPASRIWPQKTPASLTWPFIRIDSMTATPGRYDCAEGSEITGTAHCFTKVDTSVLDPEAQAMSICDLMGTALEALGECHIGVVQIIMDPEEADAFHGMVPFRLSKV